MSKLLDELDPEFADKVRELMKRCQESGYPMNPLTGIRSPVEQAKLWRQSRTAEEIQNKIADLMDEGAGFLAECIEAAGNVEGPHVTNALPGTSWHQWGLAVDCVWVVDGKAEWSYTKKIDGVNGYENYATLAEELGLNAGGHWKSFQDWPHIQATSVSSPLKQYDLAQISAEMKKRFG